MGPKLCRAVQPHRVHVEGLSGSGERRDIGATLLEPEKKVQRSGQRDKCLRAGPNSFRELFLFNGEGLSTVLGPIQKKTRGIVPNCFAKSRASPDLFEKSAGDVQLWDPNS
jgi:hypothetical protein